MKGNYYVLVTFLFMIYKSHLLQIRKSRNFKIFINLGLLSLWFCTLLDKKHVDQKKKKTNKPRFYTSLFLHVFCFPSSTINSNIKNLIFLFLFPSLFLLFFVSSTINSNIKNLIFLFLFPSLFLLFVENNQCLGVYSYAGNGIGSGYHISWYMKEKEIIL